MKVKWLPVSLIMLPYPCLAVTAWLFAWQGTLDGSLLPARCPTAPMRCGFPPALRQRQSC